MTLKTKLLLGVSILISSAVNAQTTQRMPLYETFTSSTCPPCKPGNEHLEALFAQPENDGKYVSLKYQMNWPGTGDPYFTTEGNSRKGYYGVSSVPRLELDGGFDAGPTGLTQGDMDAAYATPAEAKITAFYQVDEAAQTVTIQISILPLVDLPSSGGLFVHTAIFENQTTNNVKSNGETVFEHVMKKLLPSATGTHIGGKDAGELVSLDFSYTFAGDYILPPSGASPVNHAENHTIEEFSDLGVVVWLQRSSTKEVYQAAYAIEGESSGINKDEYSNNLSIYPNPSQNFARISMQSEQDLGNSTLQVVDNSGKVVLEENFGSVQGSLVYDIETGDLENGMYFVILQTNEGRLTKKLSVLH